VFKKTLRFFPISGLPLHASHAATTQNNQNVAHFHKDNKIMIPNNEFRMKEATKILYPCLKPVTPV
jgi:collagenase-like PrtC family protease